MKRSAEAAPEPDSVHPAGLAAFFFDGTVHLISWLEHDSAVKEHLRFYRSGHPVWHRKP